MEKEVKKFIDFIITQKCTYSCPYCSQSKSKLKEPKNANKKTAAIMQLFKSIPFAIPYLMQIVVKTGLTIFFFHA